MKIESVSKRLTFKIIIGLVAFLVLVTIVFFIKEVFRYKILYAFDTEILAVVMVSVLGLIAGLAIINHTANMNLISEHFTGEEKKKTAKSDAKLLLYGALGLLAVIITIGLTLHFVNASNTRRTAGRILAELTELTESNPPIIDRVVNSIRNENDIETLSKMLTILDQSALTIDYLELMFPKEVEGKTVLLYVNRWSNVYNRSFVYSPISDNVFMTSNPRELEYLQGLFEGGATNAGPEYFVKRPNITVYFPVVRDGKVVFVLYSSYNSIQGSFNKYAASY